MSDKGAIKNIYGMGSFFRQFFEDKKRPDTSNSLEMVYKEKCPKVIKSINDSLLTIENSSQWVWFANQEFSKSASLRRNIDFDIESDRLSVGSMELLELETTNLNKMSSKFRVDKGLL